MIGPAAHRLQGLVAEVVLSRTWAAVGASHFDTTDDSRHRTETMVRAGAFAGPRRFTIRCTSPLWGCTSRPRSCRTFTGSEWCRRPRRRSAPARLHPEHVAVAAGLAHRKRRAALADGGPGHALPRAGIAVGTEAARARIECARGGLTARPDSNHRRAAPARASRCWCGCSSRAAWTRDATRKRLRAGGPSPATPWSRNWQHVIARPAGDRTHRQAAEFLVVAPGASWHGSYRAYGSCRP